MNRHQAYPRSSDGTVHEEAYVAATFDGQLSVTALCGATTFYVVTDGRTPDCEACARAKQYRPGADVHAPPEPRCAACGRQRVLIDGRCASCRESGITVALLPFD